MRSVTFTFRADFDNNLHITTALATSAMLSRIVRPGYFEMTVIYLYVLLSIVICPCVTALRGHTPADYKFADACGPKLPPPR